MQEICLRVKNIQALNPNCSHYHIFDYRGGSIGSGGDNTWVLNDKENQIQNIQALINFEEEIFGLKPYDRECKIFLNDSFSSVPYSYESEIKLGDYFRIGGLEIEVITQEALHEEQSKIQSVEELGELKPYDKLDNLKIQPKGMEENFDPIPEEKLELVDNEDILGLVSTNAPASEKQALPTKEANYFVSYDNIQKMIYQKTQELQQKLPQKSSLKLNEDKLKMLELQSRIEHFTLLENREILNLLVLSLLCESLQNPLLEQIYPDYFTKGISELVEECINGEGELMQKALLAILALRSKKDKDEQ